ncbi:stress response protein SCP2 [Chryseobacterium ginsenosidimutans]|nr:TerD family protein [Chryseobacterium ginsenosidimutans]MCS3871160.1 stress response protein SCP2 [Chryseobacterium ginsenosidimutans]
MRFSNNHFGISSVIRNGITKMTIGLGWDPNKGKDYDFDIDASAMMIDSQRKLP